MTDAQDFVDYLEGAMEAFKLSQADLGRATGISTSVISKWLGGAQPSMDNLRSLAPVLRVTPMELFVAAGHVRLEESGLAALPEPPRPSTPEEAIRADPTMTERGKRLLLELLPMIEERAAERRAEEEAQERPRRRKRPA